jgi:hypothetical protein
MKKEGDYKIKRLSLFISILIISLLIIFPMISSTDLASGSKESGWALLVSAIAKIINPSNDCKVLQNNGGKTYFVPTKTAAEWNAFSAVMGRLGVSNLRPCNSCGDGVILSPNDDGVNEQCDNGANNGVTCTPDCESSCTYCSANCALVTVNGDTCRPDPSVPEPPDPSVPEPGEPPTGGIPPGGCVLGDCGFIPT